MQIKAKNLACNFINHDSSFSMLSYTYTDFFQGNRFARNRTTIHTILKMSTCMRLSKQNNSILEIRLSKENRENKLKLNNQICFSLHLFIYRIKIIFEANLNASFHCTITKIMNLVTELDECYEDETSLTSMKLSLFSSHSDPAMSANLLMWYNI